MIGALVCVARVSSRSWLKRLGGALHMETKSGEGTVFTIRLPFTLAISHALVASIRTYFRMKRFYFNALTL